jgi:hypothetical protein
MQTELLTVIFNRYIRKLAKENQHNHSLDCSSDIWQQPLCGGLNPLAQDSFILDAPTYKTEGKMKQIWWMWQKETCPLPCADTFKGFHPDV